MKNNLAEILEKLSNQIKVKEGSCSILPDNGFDESVLIGTPNDFLLLALKLIQFVHFSKEPCSSSFDIEEEKLFDVKVTTTNEVKKAFDEFSPVWPICAYLINENDKEKFVGGFKRKLRQNANALPVYRKKI
ncbi:MAG: hypothetical protein HQM08_30625 [Candidatus Riflebacteria bacterium]|nr:hypothetical protein [Candidatus Riflebacteria bacterium]